MIFIFLNKTQMALAHAIQWYESRITHHVEILADILRGANTTRNMMHNTIVLFASDLQALAVLKKVVRETCINGTCPNMQNGMPHAARSICSECVAPHCRSCADRACTQCNCTIWTRF